MATANSNSDAWIKSALHDGFKALTLGHTQGDWTEIALRLGYASSRGWQAIAYVENLSDEFYWDGANPNGGIIPAHWFGPSRPRTLGLRLSWDFD